MIIFTVIQFPQKSLECINKTVINFITYLARFSSQSDSQ